MNSGNSSYISSHKYSSVRNGEYSDDDSDANNRNPTRLLEKRIQDQNKNLDSLEMSVSRLGDMSLSISKEINTQNRMLDELDEQTDRAEDIVKNLTNKTKELVKKSGGTKMVCAIITLTLVLLFLIFLVIYT